MAMAYKTSAARRSFEQQAKIYQAKLIISDAKTIDPGIREYVIAAAVFLTHATLENYIKEIFDAIGRIFCSPGVTSKDLPQELRIFSLSKSANWESHYAYYQLRGDEVKLLSSLKQIFNNPKISLIQGSSQAPRLTGSDILTGKAYPSIENLEKIFSRIGINNLFDQISGILKADGKLLIKSFSDKRTELAHNAVMPGTSAQDIRSEIKKITSFIGAIDKICYIHVSSHLPQRIWDLEAR